MTVALYYTAVEIRKNALNKEQTDRQRIQLQRPLLSAVDRQGERTNSLLFLIKINKITP